MREQTSVDAIVRKIEIWNQLNPENQFTELFDDSVFQQTGYRTYIRSGDDSSIEGIIFNNDQNYHFRSEDTTDAKLVFNGLMIHLGHQMPDKLYGYRRPHGLASIALSTSAAMLTGFAVLGYTGNFLYRLVMDGDVSGISLAIIGANGGAFMLNATMVAAKLSRNHTYSKYFTPENADFKVRKSKIRKGFALEYFGLDQIKVVEDITGTDSFYIANCTHCGTTPIYREIPDGLSNCDSCGAAYDPNVDYQKITIQEK